MQAIAQARGLKWALQSTGTGPRSPHNPASSPSYLSVSSSSRLHPIVEVFEILPSAVHDTVARSPSTLFSIWS